MGAKRARENLADRAAERWAPPPLVASHSAWDRAWASVRRYFDLQAGSIWRDIANELGDASGKLVDVGCGGQPYRSLLPREVTYVGLDIAEAKARFGYQSPDTLYFDGREWPTETHGADVVLCTETLEHAPEPSVLLAEAFKCLKPGGRLLLTVPFAARWHFVPHDYWRFTPSALKQLLETAGFSNVVVVARGNAMTVACYKAMALFLPLLSPQNQTSLRAWSLRAAGAAGTPLFLLLAVAANLSFALDGRDDCLGYTASAARPRT